MVEVRLTYPELILAGNAGVLRQVSVLKKGAKSRDAEHNDNLQGDVNGATAEIAVAKWLNIYWHPNVGIDHALQVPGDVGHIEVRSTWRPRGGMLMHAYSIDERPYLFVRTYRSPVFELHGWLWGREAKRHEWWDESLPRPAFNIRPHHLRPLDTLPRP